MQTCQWPFFPPGTRGGSPQVLVQNAEPLSLKRTPKSPPNYPLRNRKYNLTEAKRPLIKVHCGMLEAQILNFSKLKGALAEIRTKAEEQKGHLGSFRTWFNSIVNSPPLKMQDEVGA